MARCRKKGKAACLNIIVWSGLIGIWCALLLNWSMRCQWALAWWKFQEPQSQRQMNHSCKYFNNIYTWLQASFNNSGLVLRWRWMRQTLSSWGATWACFPRFQPQRNPRLLGFALMENLVLLSMSVQVRLHWEPSPSIMGWSTRMQAKSRFRTLVNWDHSWFFVFNLYCAGLDNYRNRAAQSAGLLRPQEAFTECRDEARDEVVSDVAQLHMCVWEARARQDGCVERHREDGARGGWVYLYIYIWVTIYPQNLDIIWHLQWHKDDENKAAVDPAPKYGMDTDETQLPGLHEVAIRLLHVFTCGYT